MSCCVSTTASLSTTLNIDKTAKKNKELINPNTVKLNEVCLSFTELMHTAFKKRKKENRKALDTTLDCK